MAYKGEWDKGGDPTERGEREREIELWLIHAAQNQREQLPVLPALAERRETERKAGQRRSFVCGHCRGTERGDDVLEPAVVLLLLLFFARIEQGREVVEEGTQCVAVCSAFVRVSESRCCPPPPKKTFAPTPKSTIIRCDYFIFQTLGNSKNFIDFYLNK
jgi:hypothetical protein